MTEKTHKSWSERAGEWVHSLHKKLGPTGIGLFYGALFAGGLFVYESGMLSKTGDIISHLINSKAYFHELDIMNSWKTVMEAQGYPTDHLDMDYQFRSNGYDMVDEHGVSHRMEFVRDENGIVTGVRDTGKPAFGTGATIVWHDTTAQPGSHWVWHYEGNQDVDGVNEGQYKNAEAYYKEHGATLTPEKSAGGEHRLIDEKGATRLPGSTTVTGVPESVFNEIKGHHNSWVDSQGRAWQIWYDEEGKPFRTRLPDSMKAGLPTQNAQGAWSLNGRPI